MAVEVVKLAIRSLYATRMWGQLARYGLVVASGYLLAIALYSGELAIGIRPYPALGIAFVLNGLYNFALIRLWAFPPSGRSVRSELGRFCVVAAGSFVVNYASFAVLYSAVGLAATTSQRLAIVIAAPVTFLGNRLWSFRRRGEASTTAGAEIRGEAPRSADAQIQAGVQVLPAPAATSERKTSYSRM